MATLLAIKPTSNMVITAVLALAVLVTLFKQSLNNVNINKKK